MKGMVCAMNVNSLIQVVFGVVIRSCNAKRFQQNFKNWTSGDSNVDKLIQESQLNAQNNWVKLEWIEYDSFENVEYVAKGGFGMIYKAIWKDGWIYTSWNHVTNKWNKDERNTNFALKCLNDSSNEFLTEINMHLKMNNSECINKVYGITKDSKTNNFMMILEYTKNGNLRQRLNKYFNSFGWREKLGMLRDIVFGLNEIHKEGLIHQDFHSGNILDSLRDSTRNITDLGLCKPANNKSENYEIYGVLPYLAPEILRERKYVQASNIYSFGIIMFEIFNVLPPYYDIAHEELLAIKICQGLRPKFNIKVPKLIKDIANQCVDVDPLKRPNAEYLKEIFDHWCDLVYYKKDSEICKQINETDVFNERHTSFVKSKKDTYTIHPRNL
ncbi:hypothetical protein RclHR1_08390001 [Rhizophagus clarus]|uniref:Kinase-like domain-containing protein n=1 Tax=Rhizophagus clarus TaxID=94130 RepID=A0A2Z6SN11_9GLOM|nr:hypothetical protein RclHR1_08390001 [Rhizophagus clarus]GET04148.1 kinase-like domain-containing protein [Rhizophagus clarus]